jgi:hypothetical protein
MCVKILELDASIVRLSHGNVDFGQPLQDLAPLLQRRRQMALAVQATQEGEIGNAF